MSELEDFLATIPVFRELTPDQLRDIAPLFREERYSAGKLILRQAEYAQALYLLRSGRLAVRVHRPEGRETVAFLQPPTVFGELSFITGRACSADVEVVVDADVLALPREAVARLPKQREGILRGMMTLLAERLYDTVTRGTRAAESPVVLLRIHPNWKAPLSFASELGRSLARQTEKETLVVNLGSPDSSELRSIGERAFLINLAVATTGENVRARIAESLTTWKQRFPDIVLNPVGPQAGAIFGSVEAFADHRGDLVGPGDKAPEEVDAKDFVVQDAELPTLPVLSGRQQLIWEVAASEEAYRSSRPVAERFRRTVDSMARHVADLQVGLALGGGAAWGWVHIGVLATLEGAGLPVDVISGCSMGTVIGALRSSGCSVAELREIADYWCGRTKRFVEWRFWRMHLLNEKVVRKTFSTLYFQDRAVNQTEIPFWANAVDITTGKEFTIQDGSLVDAVRASIGMPGLLPPFRRGKHMLVDAGIMDPVPAKLVRRMGCRYAIAVNAMAPMEAQELSDRYPLNIFDVLFRCMRITGHEIGQARCEAAADVVLTSRLGDISMLEFGRCKDIIKCGQKVAEENLPAILAGYDRLKASASAPQPNLAEQRI